MKKTKTSLNSLSNGNIQTINTLLPQLRKSRLNPLACGECSKLCSKGVSWLKSLNPLSYGKRSRNYRDMPDVPCCLNPLSTGERPTVIDQNWSRIADVLIPYQPGSIQTLIRHTVTNTQKRLNPLSCGEYSQ